MQTDNLSNFTEDRASEGFDIFAEYKGIKELDDFLVAYNKEHKASYAAYIDEYGVTIFDETCAVEVAHIAKSFLTFGEKTPILEAFNADIDTLKCDHHFKGFYDSDLVIEATNWTDFDEWSIEELHNTIVKVKGNFLLFLVAIGKYFENKKVA
ncbi:hypothetical protein OFO01_07415 [Campylobacter sp. JMF_01 NE2]|uniref:hypothetical protein n=1 Tax=unclassified Campylobacter TaxID=2593542 RepID=UPI0022E9D440|nr:MULTISPECIES: hypothetical protein [unclassified Campylobacter]MDA3053207.1 hypothetical protein [Campylobacter sp. JMF_03 NE3]MDA3067610.1 hypothetical protein [Campylobacter sp. JMF_01 NE2]